MTDLIWGKDIWYDQDLKRGLQTAGTNRLSMQPAHLFTPRLHEFKAKGSDGNIMSFTKPTWDTYNGVCEFYDLDRGILFETIRTLTAGGAHSVYIDVPVYGAYQRGILDERKKEDTFEDLYKNAFEAFRSYSGGENLVYDEQTLFKVHMAIREGLAQTGHYIPQDERDRIVTGIISEIQSRGVKFREMPR